jgi:hypothetical protein
MTSCISEEDIPDDPKLTEEFRSLIGSIGYCSTTLRYDISYAVSALSRSQQDQTDNVLIGAVDVSFTMDTHTRRSRGGYINFVNDGTVRWKSGLHSIVTLSICEPEYIALCSEVCVIVDRLSSQTVIWEDKRSTILIIENECS